MAQGGDQLEKVLEYVNPFNLLYGFQEMAARTGPFLFDRRSGGDLFTRKFANVNVHVNSFLRFLRFTFLSLFLFLTLSFLCFVSKSYNLFQPCLIWILFSKKNKCKFSDLVIQSLFYAKSNLLKNQV